MEKEAPRGKSWILKKGSVGVGPDESVLLCGRWFGTGNKCGHSQTFRPIERDCCCTRCILNEGKIQAPLSRSRMKCIPTNVSALEWGGKNTSSTMTGVVLFSTRWFTPRSKTWPALLLIRQPAHALIFVHSCALSHVTSPAKHFVIFNRWTRTCFIVTTGIWGVISLSLYICNPHRVNTAKPTKQTELVWKDVIFSLLKAEILAATAKLTALKQARLQVGIMGIFPKMYLICRFSHCQEPKRSGITL